MSSSAKYPIVINILGFCDNHSHAIRDVAQILENKKLTRKHCFVKVPFNFEEKNEWQTELKEEITKSKVDVIINFPSAHLYKSLLALNRNILQLTGKQPLNIYVHSTEGCLEDLYIIVDV